MANVAELNREFLTSGFAQEGRGINFLGIIARRVSFYCGVDDHKNRRLNYVYRRRKGDALRLGDNPYRR
jgi:hypothetical protein